MNKFFLCICLLLFCSTITVSQNTKLKIFLDCNQSWLCDQEYLRNELTAVDFVRDRFLCDVQVISTVQFTNGGGESNQIRLVGLREFENLLDTFTYFNDVTAMNDIKRKKMLKTLQVGLIPYLIKKNKNVDFVDIAYTKLDSAISSTPGKDPWNYFQFSIGSNGWFNGDKNTSSSNINNNFSISRETTKSRFNFAASNQINRNKFTYFNAELESDEEIKVVNDNQELYTSYTLKLSEHLGVGVWSNFERSVFNNIDARYTFFPQIEYSLFPYKDYNTSRIIAQYSIGNVNLNYRDTTIYLKVRENLIRQDFNLIADFTKPWGNISVGAKFKQYLKDPSINNLSIGGGLSWNIFKGLKFSVGGELELVRDQLSLPKQTASRDDLLTQRRIISTSYNYFGGVGFSYTFGSIYNSQVHPAFRGLNWGLNF